MQMNKNQKKRSRKLKSKLRDASFVCMGTLFSEIHAKTDSSGFEEFNEQEFLEEVISDYER